MIQNRTKVIIIIAASTLVLSVAIFGIFLGVVSKQKVEHVTHSQDRADAKAHQVSLQQLMQVLDETKEERESLNTRFVQDEEVINLLALIETLGKEQGVILTTDSLTVEPENEYFEVLVIKIATVGQYPQVMNLLSLIENLPYQTSIHSVDMQKNDDKTWKGSFEINVTKFTKI